MHTRACTHTHTHTHTDKIPNTHIHTKHTLSSVIVWSCGCSLLSDWYNELKPGQNLVCVCVCVCVYVCTCVQMCVSLYSDLLIIKLQDRRIVQRVRVRGVVFICEHVCLCVCVCVCLKFHKYKFLRTDKLGQFKLKMLMVNFLTEFSVIKLHQFL